MIKRTVSIVCSLCLLACFSIPAMAANEDNTLPESTTSEVEFMFRNKDNYEIIDSKGNDITKEFFERNENNYANGTIDAIIQELSQQNLSAVQVNDEKNCTLNFSTRSLLQSSRSITVTHYVVNAYYVKFTVTGNYEVRDYDNKIMAAYRPYVSGKTTNMPLIGDYSFNMSYYGFPDPTISADQKTVTFYYSGVIYVENPGGDLISQSHMTNPRSFSASVW